MGISGSTCLVNPATAGALLRRTKTLEGLLRSLLVPAEEAGIEIVRVGDRPFVTRLLLALKYTLPWAPVSELSDALDDGTLGSLLRPGDALPPDAFTGEPSFLEFLDARQPDEGAVEITEIALRELGLDPAGRRTIGDSMEYVLLGTRNTAELLLFSRVLRRHLVEDANADALRREPQVTSSLELLAALPITRQAVLVEVGA